MTRKPAVLRDYTKANPLKQVQFGNNVVAALSANPSVFDPADLPVSIADLTAVTNALSVKYNDFKTKGPGCKEAFIIAQSVWLTKFNLTADFVELVARSGGINAGAIIALSNFRVSKTLIEPAGFPEQPQADMTISNAERNSMAVKVKPLKGSKAFLYTIATPDIKVKITGNQITLQIGNSFASVIVSTGRAVKFQSLPASEVRATVAAVNNAGLGRFSAVTDVKIP